MSDVNVFKHAIYFLLLIIVTSSDPDITTDFIGPKDGKPIDGNFFTFTGFRPLLTSSPQVFTVTKATMAEFPALNGQSVSYAVLQFPAGTINPPHTHPRSAELLFLTYGTLEVGFIDTSNKLYTQTLQAGDMFVFPKGLVHFQFSNKGPAAAISSFGSASAGTVSLPATLFSTSIDDEILAKSFKTDDQTIQKIKSAFAPKA